MIRRILVGASGLVVLVALAFWHLPILLPANAATVVSSDFAYRLGEAALAADRPERAERLARQSLRYEPLDVKNLGLLALAREARGDRAGAGSLMSLASAYSWREGPVQRWLFIASATTGDYREMVLRADALARRSRGQDMTVSVLFLGALDEASAELVADRVAADPPYRESFFMLSRQIEVARFDAFENFISLLTKRGSPPTDAELLPFVRRLFDEAEVTRAERVWFRGRPEQEGSQILRDASFAGFGESMGTNVDPFGWVLQSNEIPVEFFVGSPDGMSDETALNIRSSELGPIELLSQVVRLPQSRYDFSIERKVEEGDGRELGWRLICIADGQANKPVSTAVNGSRDWERVTYTFQIPDCAAFRLTAFLDNPSAKRQSVWIRKPSLRPAGRSSGSAAS